MAENTITVETRPRDLMQRLERYPSQFDRVMKVTMGAAMLTAVEQTPRYPSKPPTSTYVRTGTLGRTLGVGRTGGVIGQPDIFTSKRMGQAVYEGAVGTNLEYAPFVIGDGTQAGHMSHWWTVSTWSKRAAAKIVRLYDNTMNQVARWLDGMG